MDSDPKQRNQRHKRRDRAARMLKQKQAQDHRRGDVVSADEDDSPIREKRPPNRKKRIKEPLFQEDIVDGFAFLSFKTYGDLEKAVSKLEKKETEATEPVLNNSHPQEENQNANFCKKNNEQTVKKKNFLNKVNSNHKDGGSSNDENCRPDEGINESPRSISRDQLSDVSSHASLEKGYMCDSESGNDRGSDAECDLFSHKPSDKVLPIINKSSHTYSQSCRSPPVLPPISLLPDRHLEPSMAIAAVTATTSPTNTVAAVVVSSTSPQEPQVGSPAVVSLKCTSPSSPPAGVVPHLAPSFLHRGEQNSVAAIKETASTSKFVSNGYDFIVSNHSATSQINNAKLQSPNKFLHKRIPPVPTNRENTSTNTSAINVYDFVSDHSAPSSPDAVIFLSQSKFHHKVVPPPVSNPNKESTSDKNKVSNGQTVISSHTASPVPVLASALSHSNHKSVPENISKPISCVKSEPSVNSSHSNEHMPQISVSQPRLQFSIPVSTSQMQRPPSPLAPRLHVPPSSSALSSLSTTTSPSSLPPSLSSPSVTTIAPICTRVSVTNSSVTISSTSSHTVHGRSSSSPIVTVSHPNTPTPIPTRDTHSSHSNSSLSSLSQFSTPVHKDVNREGATSRSRSSSRNNTPSVSVASVSSSTTYSASSSLASLVFSKSHSWVSSSANILSNSAHHINSPLPTCPTSPALSSTLPLPPSLHSSHHSASFSSHPAPPPPPLLPVTSHHNMFTSPIPPPGSLTPTLPLEASAGPSPFRNESIFPQPNPDFLRRELDTRFLASQDRTIPIPPPPYMQAEVHQHGHIHQQNTFLPQLGAPLVNQPTPHLYDKYPKLDSSLYGRPSLGLSSYQGMSSLFTPTGSTSSTPFVPPGHLAGLQKVSSSSTVKNKNIKPGKWCAMHVRIAWEIYNHQQKQKRAETHKQNLPLSAATAVKPGHDPLHPPPPGHMFSSLSRTHDLSPFSTSILGATAAHQRAPFEANPHHGTFLNPAPAHLGKLSSVVHQNYPGGVSPFARPGYPGFGTPGSSFTGLSTLGLHGSSVLGSDLGVGCLTQDPWQQRTPLGFSGTAPWGGLKEEAERERIQREQERKREEERQRRAEQERERREKEIERSKELERERERKEQERQKERDREARMLQHQVRTSANVQNGDVREWERMRDRREIERSPVMGLHVGGTRFDGILEHQHPGLPPKLDVKVKQEKRDDDLVKSSIKPSLDRKRMMNVPHSEPDGNALSRNIVHGSMPLNPLDRTHTVGPLGLVPKDHPPHSQVASPWGSLVAPSTATTTVAGAGTDHFRTRDLLQSRNLEQERRYETLQTVMSVSSRNRCSSTELTRQLSGPTITDLDRQLIDREHQAAAVAAAFDRKLLPPPLRTNDPPYIAPPPPSLPPASVASFFSPPVSPYLNSLCTSVRNKTVPPSVAVNGLPPPLIPCTFPVQNHAGFHSNRVPSPLPHKLGAISGSTIPNLHEAYFPKERREVNGHPADLDSHLRL